MFGLLRVTARCDGVPSGELLAAANGIEFDFRRYRPWHQNVRCWPEDGSLVVVALTDFDEDGTALCDDLRSALHELVSEFGPITVVAVEPVPDPSNDARLPIPMRPAGAVPPDIPAVSFRHAMKAPDAHARLAA
jgi:hypothetical protein